MPEFKNLTELEKYVQSLIKESLVQDVAEVVKEAEQLAIEGIVYKGYRPNSPDREPWVYERRGMNGGLQDKKNMVVDVSDDGESISVTNKTRGKDDPSVNVAGLVEYGHQGGYGEYDFDRNRDSTAWQYLRPRPFTEETIKILEQTEYHVEALKKGMKRKGIDIKEGDTS